MTEVYREIFNHNNCKYVIVIFRTMDGFLIKIFFNGKVINEFEGSITVEDFQNWVYFMPTHPWDALIDIAKEWIRTNR